MSKLRILALPILIAFLGFSCGQSVDEPRVATDQELLERWMEVAAQPEMDIGRASALTQQLIQRNPQNINLFFRALANPETPPRAKLQAMLCLMPYLTPDMAPQLIELTEPEFETTSRTCATHMLATLDLPAARARLQELKNDENHRVQMAAKLALLIHMDPEVVAEVETLWDHPQTTAADQEQMVLVLTGHDADQFMPLYEEAVTIADLSLQARMRAVEYLGRKGGASAVVPLKEVAADPNSPPGLRQLAQSALGAVESRAANAPSTPAGTAIDATEPTESAAPDSVEATADPVS